MARGHARLRVAIVGSGGMAHTRAAHLLEDARAAITCVSSRNPVTGRALAERCARPLRRALGGGRSSRPDVDAVFVTTHNDSHAPIAQAALEAGKHVLVEYPLAMTLRGGGRPDRHGGAHGARAARGARPRRRRLAPGDQGRGARAGAPAGDQRRALHPHPGRRAQRVAQPAPLRPPVDGGHRLRDAPPRPLRADAWVEGTSALRGAGRRRLLPLQRDHPDRRVPRRGGRPAALRAGVRRAPGRAGRVDDVRATASSPTGATSPAATPPKGT